MLYQIVTILIRFFLTGGVKIPEQDNMEEEKI